jgi:hypothetical protein
VLCQVAVPDWVVGPQVALHEWESPGDECGQGGARLLAVADDLVGDALHREGGHVSENGVLRVSRSNLDHGWFVIYGGTGLRRQQ